MKKRLAVILVLIMLLMFGACGNSDSQVTDPSSSSQSTINNEEQPTDATEGTTGATQTPTDEPTSEPTEAPTTLPTTPPTTSPTTPLPTAPTTSPTTSPTTPPTTSPVACSHNWNKATCTAPKTCSKCGRTEGSRLAHTEVVIPAKHATFSVSGLSEGAKCSVCGTVTKAQQVIAALGNDMVVGTDYYDKTGQTTYRYSYSFTLYENDRFNLVTLKVGSDESYELTGEDGSINYLNNGVYELVFDNGRERMYGKFAGDQFQFCNKDGSKWKDKEERPQGATTVNITPRPGNSVYGYQDLAHNTHGKSMQELYYRLYAACEAFVDKKDNISPINGKYIVDRINLDYYILTADEAVAVWKVFLTENPRYYWLSNSVSLQGGVLELCIDPAYANGAYRNQCDAAIETLAAKCSAKLSSGMSQMEKAMVIHDFILGQMDYAYEADGVTPQDDIWAHNLIGCAEKKSGVCETYAKTYQYLCKRNGLNCIVVTGFNGEKHAWNMVELNGKWYGVDCTFDETMKEAVSYACFGMNASRMSQDYTADTPGGNGVDYLYKLPQAEDQGIELVDLYKNGAYVGVYANVDAAFAAMTDPAGNYEVRLFSYDIQGPLLLGAAAVEHRTDSTQTPNVKSITIRGRHIDMGSGYYTSAMLLINKALSLRSDLVIYDLNVFGNGSLDIKSQKLSCLGSSVKFDIPITGSVDSASPSEIYVEAYIECYEPVRVHTFRQDEWNAKPVFREDTYIVKAKTPYLTFFDGFNIGFSAHVEEFCPPPVYGDLPTIGIDYTAKVTVDKITAPSTEVCFHMKFGKLEEFGTLTVGSCNTNVVLWIDGTVHNVITVPDGNDTWWIESVNPKNLTVPLATLLDRSVMERLKIYTLNWIEVEGGYGGTTVDHTDEYTLNSQNQIVLK